MDTKKRRKALAACLIAAVALLTPHRVRDRDGTAYIAALYSVRQVGVWNIGAWAPYQEGTVVTVLGIEVFNSLE